MKNNCKKFLLSLRNRKNIEIHSVYKTKDTFWLYYYSITGRLNGKYFMIYLHSSEKSKHSTEIPEHVNECEDEVKIILKKFNLI